MSNELKTDGTIIIAFLMLIGLIFILSFVSDEEPKKYVWVNDYEEIDGKYYAGDNNIECDKVVKGHCFIDINKLLDDTQKVEIRNEG